MSRCRSGQAQLVVMARGPSPGRCKRRLAMGLGITAAAAVHDRLCNHTLAVVAGAQLPTGAETVLAVQGMGQRAARRWAWPRWATAGPDLRIVEQGKGTLGVLMQRQLMRALREGAGRVVLIGSDLPTLESGDLGAAFQALESSPLVLGPAGDGGYWLIGLAGRCPALFAGIAWGTNQVLRQTLAAAEAAGLRATLLAERGDLDRPVDLQHWR